jgi:hypothetical protein
MAFASAPIQRILAAERSRISRELVYVIAAEYDDLFSGTSYDASEVQAVPVDVMEAAITRICHTEDKGGEDFASDPVARALANGEEHGYARGARDERARIRRELLEAIMADLRAALDRIAPQEG